MIGNIKQLARIFCLLALTILPASEPALADAEIETYYKRPVLLKEKVERSVLDKPVTLFDAVQSAEKNYPEILKGQAQVQEAKENVTVQKLNEYVPDSLYQFQEVMASHNKLSQTIYGSPVFPAESGPGFNFVSMTPLFFSGQGFSLDWTPIDFGLHKARINVAKARYDQARLQYGVTQFDVTVQAANNFLDAVQAAEQVRAAEANVDSFRKFASVVHAQVDAYLKPGADASLAEAQLANAENILYRAKLSYDVARASLANAMGFGGLDLAVDETGIVTAVESENLQKGSPIFEDVPILQATKATILVTMAQRRVLNKEWWPVLHWLGGVSTRGAELNVAGKNNGQDAAGLGPVTPNYQLALIFNWNFLDIIRLHWEKKVQDQRIIAQQQEYEQVLENLKTEDVKSQARMRTAIAIAANMPVQVHAATMAVQQAQARYQTGLGGVAQVAEAEQVLAQSRLDDAVAKVGVWRSLLAVGTVHGDLKPFLTEAKKVQGGQ